MMGYIKRYDYSCCPGSPLEVSSDGDWVEWDDVEEIIKERDDLRLRLKVVLPQLEEVEDDMSYVRFSLACIKLYLKDL
jgi:hypothetical protein